MLVRTRAEVAEKVFLEFMEEFPKPELLCSSDLTRVANYFRKLGLPGRAGRLVGAVCTILSSYGGEVPCDYAKLRELPGVGDYIARVMLSRVCGRKYAFVDSNVLRVLSRFYGRPMRISEAARALEESLGGRNLLEVNVALIDLGASVCRPGKPRCPDCPLGSSCSSYSVFLER